MGGYEQDYWAGVVTVWIICGVIGGAISNGKNRGFGEGFLLGLLLGPIGILIAAVLSPRGPLESHAHGIPFRECPHCKSAIRADATVCAHCQRESPSWRFHEGLWWWKDENGRDFYFSPRQGRSLPWEPATEREPAQPQRAQEGPGAGGRAIGLNEDDYPDPMQSFYRRPG